MPNSPRNILMNNPRFSKLNLSSIPKMDIEFMRMERGLEEIGILPGLPRNLMGFGLRRGKPDH
jgi:hypothetical protein